MYNSEQNKGLYLNQGWEPKLKWISILISVLQKFRFSNIDIGFGITEIQVMNIDINLGISEIILILKISSGQGKPSSIVKILEKFRI